MKCVVVFLVALLIASVFSKAADLSDLTWTTTNGEVPITNCDESATGELIIPDTIEGNTVTGIGDHAFERSSILTSITIPESVTSIEEFAFAYCTSLTNITILDGVTSICLEFGPENRAAFFRFNVE